VLFLSSVSCPFRHIGRAFASEVRVTLPCRQEPSSRNTPTMKLGMTPLTQVVRGETCTAGMSGPLFLYQPQGESPAS
jgi:hypothetical protein